MKSKILIISLLLFSNISLFSQVVGNLLKIQGESIISATPEEMIVEIPVSVKDSLYSKCSDQLIGKYNNLVSELNKNGIKKDIIKADRMQISESYKWSSDGQKFEGYAGTINVLIELKYDAATLNKIIMTLNEEDIKLTYNVRFQLSKEQKESLLKKSIENAISDATNKANIISKSTGLKLVEIKEINFGYVATSDNLLTTVSVLGYGTQPRTKMTGSTAAINPDTPLNPQEMEISKSIGIIWRIEK
jgi:uncharacterized protein YggE